MVVAAVGLGMNVSLVGQVKDAGIAVGIGGFSHVDDTLNLGRLARLDGHRQSQNPLGMGLDPTGIDPRLNQPSLRTLERLDMGELMGHVSARF